MTQSNMPYEHDDNEISKSEAKREMQRWQDLGKRLTELNNQQWQQLSISENLLNALLENKRLKQHEAKRRHLQYIGKLMRDENIELITHELELLDPSSEIYGRIIRQQEQWRTRLIQDSNGLNAFIEEYPHVDRQALRNLVRNAQKECTSEPPKPGTNFKKLFQFIKEQMK